jgi:hypothetical protein
MHEYLQCSGQCCSDIYVLLTLQNNPMYTYVFPKCHQQAVRWELVRKEHAGQINSCEQSFTIWTKWQLGSLGFNINLE